MGGDIEVDGEIEVICGPLYFIAEVCRKNSKCLGFNSNGYLKEVLKPENDWDNWTDDVTKGFYKKKECIDRDLHDSCKERKNRGECGSA